MSASIEMRRVVVTGGGSISALGSEWSDVLINLKAYKNFVRRIDDWDKFEKMNTRLAAPVDFVNPPYPRKKIRSFGRIALMALAATEQALHLAGYNEESPDLKNGRCGIAYGSSIGSLEPVLDVSNIFYTNEIKKIDSTTYIKLMPHTCAANLEVFYGLCGRLIPTGTACTSGSLAIGYAYETIQSGKQDIMIAGGAEELSVFDAVIFDVLFSTSTKNDTPSLTPSAFDRNRDGLVVGEGAGTLILEEYEHALQRGAKIYAEVVGFGTNTDGTHITNPARKTMARALELALLDAGITADEIGYVNMHGTATLAGDIAETASTFDVFKRAVPVSTIKNYIGHTLGACGALEAWFSINMMNEGWFAPNINLQDIDEQCAKLDYITGSGRNIKTDYIMSNNFAFGGINTSLIFKRVRQ